ncbi:tetratricopeptide repeat protein [Sphingomonas panacisoli]|nr:tetratricopeptide repeat protein [Sphingomonas panacisoli]
MLRRATIVMAAMAVAAPVMAGQTIRQRPPGNPVERSAPDDEDDDTAVKSSRAAPSRDSDDDRPSVAVRNRGTRSPAFDAKYDAGMAAIRAKNPGKAVELMRPVLADFERQYAGEKRDIFCALTPEQSSRYLADAAKANRPALAVDSGWCRAQYVTGYALIDLDKLAEAQTAFERLVRFAPQNARYLNELGYIFMKQKKWKESLDAYRRAEAAADLTPDRVKEERCLALKGVGYDLVELGDLIAAAAAYRKCLAINPDDEDSPRELKYIEDQRKLTV